MTNSIKTSYQPTYIVSRDPERFGGRQEDYIARSNAIILSTTEKLIQCRKTGGVANKLFFEIIADLDRERALIAQEHHSEDAADFGKRRTDHYPGRISVLFLGGIPYQEYGNRLIGVFYNYLKGMESEGKFKKEQIFEDCCNGVLSTLHIEVLSVEDLVKKEYSADPSLPLPSYISYHELRGRKDAEWTLEKIAEEREKFRQFKEESPENYRRWRKCSAMSALTKYSPSPSALGIHPNSVRDKFSQERADTILGNMKSIFVHALLRTEVEGKMYAMTEYHTWMYENAEWLRSKTAAQHPLERMKICSKIMLLHQDAFLIDNTLETIAKVFARAVAWNPQTQSLQELKDTMAHFVYLSAHNIRTVRGAAAETEWLEEAIYRSHGMLLANEQRIIDLEVFANPLFSSFRKAYDRLTDPKPISS